MRYLLTFLLFIFQLILPEYQVNILPVSCGNQRTSVHELELYKQSADSGDIVYQLVDSKGVVVYYGITNRSVCDRLSEHMSAKYGQFDHMEVIADGLTNRQARSMEGALIRKRINEKLSNKDRNLSIQAQLQKAGLINNNRGLDIKNWISTNPLEELKDKIFVKPKRVKC